VPTTYLYGFRGIQAFAYTMDGGRNYYLHADNSWWAYRSGKYLYDARTHKPLVYEQGRYFYGVDDNQTKYYVA
jgi:hypothetical protein